MGVAKIKWAWLPRFLINRAFFYHHLANCDLKRIYAIMSLIFLAFSLQFHEAIRNKEMLMLVGHLMTKKVEVGTLDMTLQDVAQKMLIGDFGVLPIADGDRLVGMITDRDIVIRATAAGRDPQRTLVQEIMSANVLYCYEDERLEDVAKNLGKNQVRRLPVLNREKRLVGILSLGDLAHAGKEVRNIYRALDQISLPSAEPEIFYN